MKKFIAFLSLGFAGFMISALPVLAQTTLTSSTNAEQQLKNAGTETINSGVTLNVGGSNPAIQFDDSTNGNTQTLVNKGTIEQSGTVALGTAGYAVTDNKGHSTLIIDNGSSTNSNAIIETSDDDTIHLSQGSNIVTLNNYGLIVSFNASQTNNETVNLGGITSNSNTINNYATGSIMATDSDAVRPGADGFIFNDGIIESSNTVSNTSSSDGVDAQTNSGVTIINGNAIAGDLTTGSNLIEGARHGITGGNTGTSTNSPTTSNYGGYSSTNNGAYSMTIVNNTNSTIEGNNGAGINIDGYGYATTTNPGLQPYISNELVTVTNYGTITGDGVTRDGDAIDVDGDVVVNNYGTIHSLNADNDISEGITVGGGTIMNAGTIEGSIVASSSNSGVGRGITLAGLDKAADDSQIPLESIYENSTINNTNGGVIKGDTESGIAVLGTTGGGYTVTINNSATSTIEGNNTGVNEDTAISSTNIYNGDLSGQSKNQGAIELDDTGNTYVITNYGAIKQDNTSGGTAVAMHGVSNTLNIYGGSASVIGNVSGDTAADSTLTINPGNGNSFSYGYQIANFTVKINSDGSNGTVILSGTNTYTGSTTISGGTLDLEASGLAIDSTNITVSSGTLNLDGGSTAQINSSAIVTVTNSGTFNFGSANQSLAGVVNNGGTVNYGSGTKTIADPIWTSGTNTVGPGGTTTFSDGLGVSGGNNIVETNTLLIVQSGSSSTPGGALTFSGSGSPNITVNSDNSSPGTLQVQGDIYDTDTNSTASITSGGSGSLSGKLDLATVGSARGINVSSGGTLNIGTTIIDSSNNVGVNVNGASGYTGTQGGTLVFSGNNSYTGPTTINGGALDVTGSTTNSAITAASGGTLEGPGTVGSVNVSAGGKLAPGDASTSLASTLAGSTGNALTVGNLTVNGAASGGGSILQYNLYNNSAGSSTASAPAGGTVDLVAGTFGGLSVSSTNQIVLNFNDSTVGGNNVYNLVEYGSVTGLSTSDFLIENLNLNAGSSDNLVFNTSANVLQLDISTEAVPEPDTWTMLLGGLGLLAFWSGRRRQSRG